MGFKHGVITVMLLVFLLPAEVVPRTIYLDPLGIGDWNGSCGPNQPCKPELPLITDGVESINIVASGDFPEGLTAAIMVKGDSIINIVSAILPTSLPLTLSWDISCDGTCTAPNQVTIRNTHLVNSNITISNVSYVSFASSRLDRVHSFVTAVPYWTITNCSWTHYDTDAVIDYVMRSDSELNITSSTMLCDVSDCRHVIRVIASNLPRIALRVASSTFGPLFTAFLVADRVLGRSFGSQIELVDSIIAVRTYLEGFSIFTLTFNGIGDTFVLDRCTITSHSGGRLLDVIGESMGNYTISNSFLNRVSVDLYTQSSSPYTGSVIFSDSTFQDSALSSTEVPITCRNSIFLGSNPSSAPVLIVSAPLWAHLCYISGPSTGFYPSLTLHNASVTSADPSKSSSTQPDLVVDRLGVLANSSINAIVEVSAGLIAQSYSGSTGYGFATDDVELLGPNSPMLSTPPNSGPKYLRIHAGASSTKVVLRYFPRLQIELGNGNNGPSYVSSGTLPFLSADDTAIDLGFTWGSGFAPEAGTTYAFLSSSSVAMSLLPTWSSSLSQQSATTPYEFNITALPAKRFDSSRSTSIATSGLNSDSRSRSASESKLAITTLSYSAVIKSQCPLPGPQPVSAWKCVGNQWFSVSDVGSGSTIIVSTPVIVNGNFSAAEVNFVGLNSTVQVTGCAAMPSHVIVTLDVEDYLALLKDKVLYAKLIESQCNDTEGQQVTIDVQATKKKSCEKIKGTLKSSGQTMTATFVLDSSGCNTWWIILVAVLCSVVAILIVLALVFTLVPAARRCIRPYSNRKPQNQQ